MTGSRNCKSRTAMFMLNMVGASVILSINLATRVAAADGIIVPPGWDPCCNTVLGDNAFTSHGNKFNTAIGFNALNSHVGSHNIAVGAETLPKNTIGFSNVAMGFQSLFQNITTRPLDPKRSWAMWEAITARCWKTTRRFAGAMHPPTRRTRWAPIGWWCSKLFRLNTVETYLARTVCR